MCIFLRKTTYIIKYQLNGYKDKPILLSARAICSTADVYKNKAVVFLEIFQEIVGFFVIILNISRPNIEFRVNYTVIDF